MSDESLFKSLTHTFHIIAESEEDNIAKKKKTDEAFTKEYLNTKKKRLKKRQEKEDTEEEEKEPRIKANFISDSIRQRKIKNMIPGFSIIKNRIITPLLVASERVVEYMIPEQNSKSENANAEETQENEVSEHQKECLMINDRMSRLNLEEFENRQRKHRMKCLRKTHHSVQIPKNLMNKASDCVDFISERMPAGESKVTNSFVTNMIELSDSAIKRISASCKDIDETSENINMRFIKPSKKFYNLLMSVWIKLDSSSIFNLTEQMFVDLVKQALQKEEIPWNDSFQKPTETFFKIAKEEFLSMYKTQKEESEDIEVEPSTFIFSMSRFLTSIKTTLLQMWNSEIVNKSAKFKSASVSKETEEPAAEEVKKPSDD